MAAALAGEQLQPDDLSVRPGRRADSASPPPAPPTPFSQLSRLLQAGAAPEPPAPAAPLRCPTEHCTFETFSRAALEAHARGHDSRRLYECDVCQLRFTNGANLRRHRMRHTGFKPYECRACSKRFFRRDHLLEHMSTHAKAAGRRLPWQCPVCAKGFQRQIAMRAHYQNEHVREAAAGVQCRLCGYAAASAHALHAHLAAQHGLQVGAAPTPAPAPAHLLLAPLELRAEPESPPGSPRPSQVSPNSSTQASPGSPADPGPMAGPAPAVVKTEPREPPASAEEHQDQQEDREEEEEEGEDEEQRENGLAAGAPLQVRRAPGLQSTNVGAGPASEPAGGGGGSDRAPAPSQLRSLLQERRPTVGRASPAALLAGRRTTHLCTFCGILFPDQTLYFMHKGCHAENNPWKCNICSEVCHNVYEFNSHLLSQSHQ
ncbi:Zinc finger and SCAN domain-containing protein 2 [Amphibalanus amphitrite]|uniref:Zinc finger and SCAN domain-containing protein 2 n=1 Tax=Amphibalanus amphitrite TaxID=1232801 RepID=A0A6A4XD25_AMPAM|nr:Zinc finger and SCAN domain-containing protein 2 [Amphibalanus amphitrite]